MTSGNLALMLRFNTTQQPGTNESQDSQDLAITASALPMSEQVESMFKLSLSTRGQ